MGLGMRGEGAPGRQWVAGAASVSSAPQSCPRMMRPQAVSPSPPLASSAMMTALLLVSHMIKVALVAARTPPPPPPPPSLSQQALQHCSSMGPLSASACPTCESCPGQNTLTGMFEEGLKQLSLFALIGTLIEMCAMRFQGLCVTFVAVPAGHMQLQTFYEERQRQALQSPLPPSPPADDPEADGEGRPQSTAHDRSSGLLVDLPHERTPAGPSVIPPSVPHMSHNPSSHPAGTEDVRLLTPSAFPRQSSLPTQQPSGRPPSGRSTSGGRTMWGPGARAESGELQMQQPLQRALWQRPQSPQQPHLGSEQPLLQPQQPHVGPALPQMRSLPQQQQQQRGQEGRSRLADVAMPVDSLHYLSRSESSGGDSAQELESEMVMLEPRLAPSPHQL